MIEITRALAKQLRAILRRCFRKPQGPYPPLVQFQGGTDGLHVRVAHQEVSVAFHDSAVRCGAESISLPLEALADFEGKSQDVVSLASAGPDTTLARWQEAGVPKMAEYTVENQDKRPEFPKLPEKLITAQPGLLQALDEAVQSAASDVTRYAINRVMLRGKQGEIVGTDGRQLLVQGGFSFPWSEDVLVPRVTVFKNRELGENPTVQIGKTDTHVLLRVGAWTFFLTVDKDAHYPKVEQVVPKESAGGSRLRISEEDGAFLARTLPHLPGQDEDNHPLTLDLNGQVSLRARASNQDKATEVLLARSQYTGSPVQLCVNREYLARAVELGFKEVLVSTADKPLVFKEERRIFLCMPLSKDGMIPASEDDLRIASAEEQAPQPSTERKNSTMPLHHSNGNGHAAGPDPSEAQFASGTSTSSDLLAEALALKGMLHEVYSRSSRLVVAIKKQRRQSKLVANTLASLKQLQQIES